MKIFKVISLIALVFFLQTIRASENALDPGKDGILAELTALLQKPGVMAAESDLVARVHFLINREGQIVVLQVFGENEMVESYIKARLNYMEVKSKALQPGKEYMVPVRIKASR